MRRRAFTLIELLCVIGIIAILAALYFGVFPKAFDQVKKLEKGQKTYRQGIATDDGK
jgi:prepilin-type N-terminal cleavage/methylation domain-containing protein